VTRFCHVCIFELGEDVVGCALREIHRWSLVSTKHSQNLSTRGGYLLLYGCYNGRLMRTQGALSAQRALRGALCTSAPKIGAHSTSLLSVTHRPIRGLCWVGVGETSPDNRERRQVGRGYQMWVECGSPTHVGCTHILPTFSVGKCSNNGRHDLSSPHLPQRHSSDLCASNTFQLTSTPPP